MTRAQAQYWGWGAVFFTAVGLLEFCYKYLDFLSRSRPQPFAVPLIEELTGAYGAGLLLLGFVIPWARHTHLRGGPWPRQLARFGVLVLVYSVVHTLWNGGTRTVVFAALGMGHYDYGIMPIRFAMEFPKDLIECALLITVALLFDHYRAARDRELQVAQLETELTRLRLEALEGQLRPHFLFNTLNTVSAVMYEDVAAADAMLTRLGDLLRRTLRRPAAGCAEVALGEELETLELYLAIMRVRFADRLTVEIAVDGATRRAAVPPLLLQPLVENALRHGDPGPDVRAQIRVRAWRENGRLVLEVADNGPGIAGLPEDQTAKGIGLDTTARRLRQLYGDAQAFRLSNRAEGGLLVSLELPFREVG
jgi:two-component system, LytTR family, sensor kinase